MKFPTRLTLRPQRLGEAGLRTGKVRTVKPLLLGFFWDCTVQTRIIVTYAHNNFPAGNMCEINYENIVDFILPTLD